MQDQSEHDCLQEIVELVGFDLLTTEAKIRLYSLKTKLDPINNFFGGGGTSFTITSAGGCFGGAGAAGGIGSIVINSGAGGGGCCGTFGADGINGFGSATFPNSGPFISGGECSIICTGTIAVNGSVPYINVENIVSGSSHSCPVVSQNVSLVDF